MNFWQVTTNHFCTKILFRSNDDFKVAMNYVAVVKHVTGVNILAFILMSNHVHFVLECGTREEALDFINRFKGIYSRYLLRKYGFSEFIRRNKVDIKPLWLDDDSLLNSIAYILMNSVGARLCVYATDYPWGSAPVYFRTGSVKGRSVGTMSERARERALRSCVPLPPEWTLLDEGYVDPLNYVAVGFVEKLYRTPTRLKYYFDKSSKANSRLEPWDSAPSFSDQTVAAGVVDLKRTMFQKRENDTLSSEQNRELAKQIRRRFGTDVNQLCRVTGLSYEAAVEIFDSM